MDPNIICFNGLQVRGTYISEMTEMCTTKKEKRMGLRGSGVSENKLNFLNSILEVIYLLDF